ncbi:hypothetical protein TD95_000157 [Thielaviopsis punctulata]|uniref:chitinase n=1 Tax=Thielaviopsis punctulata TaxID=72032 RepID=A0A0F4Z790_9PEZI|nr:hypothetical protein TD95_000157 [Thielaviopsis punctulata]
MKFPFGLSVAVKLMASVAAAEAPNQHPIVPPIHQVRHITHVEMAFLQSDIFNHPPPPSYPLFQTVASTRSQFPSSTKIMVAIGGWGDTAGFETAAQTASSRKTWASNVAAMVRTTGADGVDIDWEYPGGNGEHYKTDPNSGKVWEIEAYPLLLAELRAELGTDVLISAAVPGLERDMIAFTNKTMPKIADTLDFINVMTYDLMNRRDNVTKHHTGVRASKDALNAYVARGAPAQKLNLGLAFYVKYFLTETCDAHNPVGCATGPMEDPATGADLGRTGGFSWHDGVSEDVERSFDKALKHGWYMEEGGGGYGFWDEEERRWWTFDVPEVISRKFEQVVDEMGIGGVFAWGLGEDAPKFRNLERVNVEIDKRVALGRDEL